MNARTAALFGVAIASGCQDAKTLGPLPEVTLPKVAEQTEPRSGPVPFQGNFDGFQPLSLNRARVASTKAGETTSLPLGAPASAESAWVALRSKVATTVTSAGTVIELGADQPSTWALLPLKSGQLELSTDTDATLSVRTAGTLEQSGAGLELREEDVLRRPLAAGTQGLSFTRPSPTEPDDTWGLWLRIRATAAGSDVRLELRSCGQEDALEVLSVPAGTTRSALVLVPRGNLCAYVNEPLDLETQVVARFRRFHRSSFRAVAALTVVDTEAGIGWRGVPLSGQKLAVDLSRLTGLEGATALVLQAGADALAGPCGSGPQTLASGGLILHRLGTPLCLEASPGKHARLTLVGAVFDRSPEPQHCPALPPLGACAASDLLGRLNCIAGVKASRRGPDPMAPNLEQYVLNITQPVDHARPDGETFEQRVLLTYAGESAPVVLHTTGYELFSYRSDLGRHLDATELEVEHRFFGPSTPASRRFAHLDIVQSAHDSHRIVELLRPSLQGKWLSTGHSKGGMTALFHRRFFPCDVDGSVPYVTPLSYSLDDTRYGTFLQGIGGAPLAACRQVFRNIERGVIAGRANFGQRLRGSYARVGGPELALWQSTGLTSWSLFQYGDPDDPQRGCPAYLSLAASPGDFAQLVEYYASAAEAFSDEALAQAESDELFGYTYQTTNELGGQGSTREYLADLGPIPSLKPMNPLYLGSVPVPDFEARAMRDVQDWLAAHGHRFIFVYGELDPWTAGQLDLGKATESLKVFAPNTNHGARLTDLNAADSLAVTEALQRWTQGNNPRPPLAGARHLLDHQPQFRDVMQRLRL